MENEDSEIEVLKNTKGKINKYNAQAKAGIYNAAYTEILNGRKNRSCLVNKDGSVSEETLLTIEKGLLAFDMGRQMDGNFKYNLKKKLISAKALLKKFQGLTIVSPNIDEIRSETESFFESLRASDHDRLSSNRNQFSVGATKIMNFLFPELFVIADRWVRKALGKYGYFSFDEYWSIMMTCRKELRAWQEKYGNLESLIGLDEKPTTLTRIFDKCAFVTGKSASDTETVQCPQCKRSVDKDHMDEYSGLCIDCTIKLVNRDITSTRYKLGTLFARIKEASDMCAVFRVTSEGENEERLDLVDEDNRKILWRIEEAIKLVQEIEFSDQKAHAHYITWEKAKKEILWHLCQARWWFSQDASQWTIKLGAREELSLAKSYMLRLAPEIWKQTQEKKPTSVEKQRLNSAE